MESKKYNLSKQIDAITIDSINKGAFYISTSHNGVINIYKKSVYNPNSIIAEIDNVNVTKINRIHIDKSSSYMFCSAESSSYIGLMIEPSSFMLLSYLNKPIGIIENSVDITTDGSFAYFLVPGIETGENSKILKYDFSYNYIEEVDLTSVFNASKIDIDDSGNLWVISEDNPRKLTKIWYSGTWNFSTYIIV